MEPAAKVATTSSLLRPLSVATMFPSIRGGAVCTGRDTPAARGQGSPPPLRKPWTPARRAVGVAAAQNSSVGLRLMRCRYCSWMKKPPGWTPPLRGRRCAPAPRVTSARGNQTGSGPPLRCRSPVADPPPHRHRGRNRSGARPRHTTDRV